MEAERLQREEREREATEGGDRAGRKGQATEGGGTAVEETEDTNKSE